MASMSEVQGENHTFTKNKYIFIIDFYNFFVLGLKRKKFYFLEGVCQNTTGIKQYQPVPIGKHGSGIVMVWS